MIGFEGANLLSETTVFQDATTGLRVEQSTNQTYGRIYLGGRLGHQGHGISGAEYQNRPGLSRLITHLKEFDVLIMSESSRLGRDMARNTMYVVDIIEDDVQIWYYLTDEEEKADTPEQRVMLMLKSYASEVERHKASQRSRSAQPGAEAYLSCRNFFERSISGFEFFAGTFCRILDQYFCPCDG